MVAAAVPFAVVTLNVASAVSARFRDHVMVTVSPARTLRVGRPEASLREPNEAQSAGVDRLVKHDCDAVLVCASNGEALNPRVVMQNAEM